MAPWPSNLINFKRKPLAFLARSTAQYGDIFRFRVFGFPMIMLNHPDYIEHVLVEKSQNYDKQALLFKVVEPVLGNGLIRNYGGEDHRRQRMLMQPSFRPNVVSSFATNMVDETVRLLEQWAPKADTSEAIVVHDEIGKLALRIVNRSLFSTYVGDSAREFELAFAEANAILASFFSFPFPPLSIPGPRRRRLRAAIKTMRDFVETLIERRLAGIDDETDLLSMLMQATDEETGTGMSINQLHDEVLNIVIGAFETTTNTISWALYLLSRHPEIEHRLLDEVDTELSGRLPNYEDIRRLEYTRMIVDETLRLYSPAWQTMRHAVDEDVIDGYRIPANSNIYLNSYLMHRHPGFWDEPDKFEPERFAPARSVERPKHTYIPFGSGPRTCIGKYFALTELQLILATVAQRYRLVAPDGQLPIESEPLITLHPRGGVRLLVQSRA